jgi:hypothetical protein
MFGSLGFALVRSSLVFSSSYAAVLHHLHFQSILLALIPHFIYTQLHLLALPPIPLPPHSSYYLRLRPYLSFWRIPSLLKFPSPHLVFLHLRKGNREHNSREGGIGDKQTANDLRRGLVGGALVCGRVSCGVVSCSSLRCLYLGAATLPFPVLARFAPLYLP